ncbi:MAG: hypothetical protein AAF355_10300 [Myxococcota bacterium]
MVRTAKAKPKSKESLPTVEELYFRSESAYLCLVLNRRTRSIRVIDFRAGALPAKRLYIQSVAKREQVHKVITLVEKDEVSSWTRVGFVREGTIPGFYKRSDGHLCGCVIGSRTASEELTESDVKLSERTINAAKKELKNVPEELKVKLDIAEEKEALSARDQQWKRLSAIGTFDPFGRDAERAHYSVAYKKAKPNFISIEFQDCFGHSLMEVLRTPKEESEVHALTGGLRDIGEELKARGIVSAFSFAPSDDVALSTSFLAAGYRKTGLLAKAMLIGEERKDAILWTRKLANPAGDEEA